jgi:damage-control phosphatase, subfamily I
MQTYLDCIPCFVRQGLEVSRFVSDDAQVHEKVLRGVLEASLALDFRQPPPAMGQQIHRLVRELTGQADPYRKIKDHFNAFGLQLYPQLKEQVQNSDDPLETSIRLAIAGNIIDFGPHSQIARAQVEEAISHSLSASLSSSSVADFRQAVGQAKEILYLADNAGEIVFDRLLIEQLPNHKITVVVKGSPVINDATLADAQTAGLTDLVEVIDNGSDAPGTILETCSEKFRDRFSSADLILAKGQGNYETLSHVPGAIVFLLKAKCPVIARHLGVEVGSLVLRRGEESGQWSVKKDSSRSLPLSAAKGSE